MDAAVNGPDVDGAAAPGHADDARLAATRPLGTLSSRAHRMSQPRIPATAPDTGCAV